jgi:hypothetical protein
MSWKVFAPITGLILVAGLVFGSTAQAADPYKALNRKVNRLENQVDNLQGQVNGLKRDVKDLLFDVFVCTFPGGTPATFTDGTVAYPLWYDSRCLSSGTSIGGNGPVGSGRQVKAIK